MTNSIRDGEAPVINVRIPPVLRDVVDGARQLEVTGATVGEALDALFARFPALRDRLLQRGDGHAAGRLGQNPLGLGQQANRGDRVGILDALDAAAAGPRQRERPLAVGGAADGE